MSDPKRLRQVYQHIARIRCSDYPAIVGNPMEGGSGYRIEQRPFQHLAEPAKLAILQEAIDWTGVTNKDQATILLSEIDTGKITAAQRSRLIAAAAGQEHHSCESLRNELFREARPQPQPERTHERPQRR